jgi:uncharacterized protein YjbI with pentapeptide repeats
MEQAQLEGAVLKNADLTLANAYGVNFSRAVADGAIFRTANLREANFRGANIEKANFSQADISNATFEDADLRGADLRFAVGIAKVRSWAGAKLEGAILPENFHPEGRGIK